MWDSDTAVQKETLVDFQLPIDAVRIAAENGASIDKQFIQVDEDTGAPLQRSMAE